MLKLLSFLLLANICLFYCEKENKLKGTIISSDGENSETMANAFNDDYTEEFKASSLSGGWVGLELKSPHRITKIGWAQKENDKSKYFLGIFEGANKPSFIDAVPLYMITEGGKDREMNYATIDTTYSFQYVRYVGPNNQTSVISGLEFYGYEAPTDIDEDEVKLYQPTNLPLVVIHTKNSTNPIDKKTDIECRVTIINKRKRDTKSKGVIKLRGNATMRAAKSPYKIRFDSKEKLLDFPSKAKKWNLLANYNDKTLMRTALTYKMSEIFKMKYTPNCKFVDLMLNGEYKGNYELCDKVEVGKGRMEVTEMDETCNEEPEITGGYLIEATGYAKQDDLYGETNKGIVYSYRYPEREDITPEQLDFIDNFFNGIEEEVYRGIVDRIDTDSFIKYMIVQEMAGNADSLWSNYMYKERGDNKLYFGPLWDFDNSFGDDRRSYPIENFTNFIFKYSLSAGTMRGFVTKIFSNEKILQNLKDIWKKFSVPKMREILFDFIDEQYKLIKKSSKLNFIRWDILRRKKNIPTKCTFEGEIQYLKDYLLIRFNQLDKMIENATIDFINEEVKGLGGFGRPEGQGGQGGQRREGWPGFPGGQQDWANRDKDRDRNRDFDWRRLGDLGEIDENCQNITIDY